MTDYGFDHIYDRYNTNSVKFDSAAAHGLPADVLPLWVADMDFQAPPPVREALQKRLDHGIFGYAVASDSYYEAVGGWFKNRFGWETKPEWLVRTPGVVFALATAVRAFTQPGDAVIIQPPVYAPFYRVVKVNGRKLVENPLLYENGRYTMDLADFERKIVENNVKIYILCSPHNPICRVWTQEELKGVGEICRKHNVMVISDEIHCDFTAPGHDHTVFPLACPDIAQQCMVCTAPSKSFNLAGLQCSNIWFPGQKLRERFEQELVMEGYDCTNIMGLIACETAYREGADWMDSCKAYIQENAAYVREFLARHLPEIKLIDAEGTYFAWIDCTGLGLSEEELNHMIVHKAKLWLDEGSIFGQCAAQFQRIVLACPRSTLVKAMEQLAQAVQETKNAK